MSKLASQGEIVSLASLAMSQMVMDLTQADPPQAEPGDSLLRETIARGEPLVGIFGQQAGWSDHNDPVLALALARLGKPADEGWRELLSKNLLPDNFDAWLDE